MRPGCTLNNTVYDVRPGWTLCMGAVWCASWMDTLHEVVQCTSGTDTLQVRASCMHLGRTLCSTVYDVRPGWTLYMVVVQCTSQMDTLQASIVCASGMHIEQHSV